MIATLSVAMACCVAVGVLFKPDDAGATGIYRPINYQGKLTNSGGVAISNGTYDLRFRLYDAASGGVPLWSEIWNSTTQKVTSTGGLFSIALGTHTAMTGSVNFNSDNLFLQVEFDPGADGVFEEVFTPRRRFASVPYAHNADTLDGLNATQFLRTDISQTASGTLTIKPNDASKTALDLVSTAGTPATAALKIATQGANHILFGSGASNYDVNLYRASADVLKTDDSFSVVGTLSGRLLVVTGNTSVSGSLVVNRAISGTAIEVLGTASGLNLFATQSVSGTHLYAATTFGGAGLADCDTAATSKLLWDSGAKRFSCGTDQTGGTGSAPEVGTASFSGATLRLGDAHYVKKQGDTMTGALTINLTSGSLGLKIIQTASGDIIHAEKTLTSSGIILAVGSIITRNTLSGKTLVVSGNASVTGSLVVAKGISGTVIEILGTASGLNLFATRSITGTHLYAASTFGGAGLGSCSNSTNSKLLYNSATKQFACGTDQNAIEIGTASFSGAVQRYGDPRWVNAAGDTMTGALTIQRTLANSTALKLIGSGAFTLLAASGGSILHEARGNPVLVGSLDVTGNMRDIVVRGVYAYTADQAGFNIIDVSSPESPTVLGTYTSADLMEGVAVAGGYAYVTNYTSGLAILDVTKPTAPRLVGSYNTAGQARDVEVVGAIAYVADGTSGLQIIDVSNPNAPALLSTFSAASGARELAVDGRFVYIAKTSGASIVDVINPARPQLVANFSTSDLTYGIDVRGKYMYVADGATGMIVANISNPASPTTVATFDTPGFAGNVTVAGQYAYIADQTYGMYVVDISNPASPTLVGQMDTSGSPQQIAVQGRNAYIADYSPGLLIARLNGFATPSASVDSLEASLVRVHGAASIHDLSVDTSLYVGAGMQVNGRAAIHASSGAALTLTASGAMTTPLLRVVGTASGSMWHAARILTSSGTLVTESGAYIDGSTFVVQANADRVGIGTSTPKSMLDVVGTISGKTLVVSGKGSFSGSLVVAKGISGATLEVLGTASGQNLFATRSVSGTHLYAASTFGGAGLASCSNATTSKLLYNSATKQFSCGTDQAGSSTPEVGTSSFSGAVLRLGDSRYVKTAGDTMTGALVIDLTSGHIGLKIIQTASGAFIHAEKGLSSSGNLVVHQPHNATGALITSDAAGSPVLALDGFLQGTGTLLAPHILFGYRSTFDTRLYRLTGSILMTNASLLPEITNLYDLGSSTYRWRDLYLSGGTLHLGSQTLEGKIGYASTGSEGLEFFGTGGAVAPALFVSSGGHIGIGTTDPKSLLHVLGVDSAEVRLTASGTTRFARTAEANAFTWYNTVDVLASSHAVQFDGNGDRVSFSPISLGTTYTVSFWFKSADAGEDILISTSTSSYGSPIGFLRNSNALYTSDDDEEKIISYTGWDNDWHHMAVVREDTDVAFYIDGVQVGTTTFATNGSIAPDQMGGWGGAPTHDYAGLLDEVRFYTRALSSSEVEDQYNGGAGQYGLPGESGLVAGWHFDEGGGASAADYSGNGHAGTLTNQATWSLGKVIAGTERMEVPVWSSHDGEANGEQGIHTFGPVLGGTRMQGQSLTFLTNTTERLRVTSGGLIGIGTATPGSKLVVSGAVLIGHGLTGVASADSGLALEVLGTASGENLFATSSVTGSHLYAVATFGGAGLSDCDDAGTSKLLWDDATKRFACGTDQTGGGTGVGSGNVLAIGDARYVQKQGDTMTGTLVIDVAGGDASTIGLRVLNTISGAVLKADWLLASSGTLVTESGAFIDGATLVVQAGTDMVGIGTASPTKPLDVNGDARVRGVLTLDGFGTTLEVTGNVNIGGTLTVDTDTLYVNAFDNLVGIGTTAPETTLEVLGTASGQSLHAHDSLTSSGTLAVQSAAEFRGSVGIGLAAASARLSIGQTEDANAEALFLDTEESTAAQDVFRIVSDVAGDEDNAFRITADGTVYSDNAFNSSGADYAEWFLSSSGRIEPGEVVCVDTARDNAVRRCDRDADGNVMGIVSTKPAFVGNVLRGADGLPVPGYVLVGLIGQVPTKANVEAGESIRPGDSLTPSVRPGYARRARAGEATVGVALQALASGEGVVNVLISRRNQSLTAQAVEDRVLQSIEALEIDDKVRIRVQAAINGVDLLGVVARTLREQWANDEFEQRVRDIVAAQLSGSLLRPAAPTGVDTLAVRQSLAASGSIHAAGDLTAGGHLAVAGALTARDLTLSGGLVLGGDALVVGTLAAGRLRAASGASVDGMLRVAGDLDVLGHLRFSGGLLEANDVLVHGATALVGNVTVVGLALFDGDVTIRGSLTLSNHQAGHVRIGTGHTSVTVRFGSGFGTVPIVNVTPASFVETPWRVTATTATGFVLQLKQAAAAESSFLWMAIGVLDPTVQISEPIVGQPGARFPVDAAGVPLSNNDAWNACIRNLTLLNDAGQPFSCSRYHDGNVWEHPDLHVFFTYDGDLLPPILSLPPPYTSWASESVWQLPVLGGGAEPDSLGSLPATDQPPVEPGRPTVGDENSERVPSPEEPPQDTAGAPTADGTDGTEESNSAGSNGIAEQPKQDVPVVAPADLSDTVTANSPTDTFLPAGLDLTDSAPPLAP